MPKKFFLPAEIEHRLDSLSERTHRHATYYIAKAVDEYLDKYEESFAFVAALENLDASSLDGCLKVLSKHLSSKGEGK